MDCQRGFSELSPVCSAPSCQAQASNRALGPNKFGFPPRLEQGGDSKGAAASQDCGVADTALYRMKRKCSVCAVESRLPLVAEKITTPKIRFSDVESTTVLSVCRPSSPRGLCTAKLTWSSAAIILWVFRANLSNSANG